MREILEEKRAHAEKLEALGRMTIGVAHDFNNCLAVLLGSLELLKSHVVSDKGQRLLDEGLRSVERGKFLAAQLLANHRPPPAESVDLNLTLKGLEAQLVRTLPRCTVWMILSPGLWTIHANRSQIELAILNLALNARDAMPAGGTLTLETRNEELSTQTTTDLLKGDYVTLTVSDTGHGMPAEVRARALDPFFSTKGSAGGTGLGLSMVQDMVRLWGGGLRLQSEPRRGTSVQLLLPRSSFEGQHPRT